MPNYGDTSYWDKRYAYTPLGEMFDWLENYESLKPIIEQFLEKSDRILMFGCGNALLSEDMYDDGYHHITNIDIS